MTAREKAEQILDRCYELELETVYYGVNHYLAKKFALIAVGEMLEILYESPAKNVKELAFCIDVSNEIKKIDAQYKKADKLAFELMNKKTNP
jgi:hypothetical protein